MVERVVEEGAITKNSIINLENKIANSATLIDLTKAVGFVSHKLLLEKMEKYEIEND